MVATVTPQEPSIRCWRGCSISQHKICDVQGFLLYPFYRKSLQHSKCRAAAVLLTRLPQLHQPRPAVLVSCPLSPSLCRLPPRSGFQAAVTVLVMPVEGIVDFQSLMSFEMTISTG